MRETLEAQHVQSMRQKRSLVETKPLRKKAITRVPESTGVRRVSILKPRELIRPRGLRRFPRGTSPAV